MNIYDLIVKILLECKNKRMTLTDIEKQLPSNLSYEAYAGVVMQLLDEGIISPVVAAGKNHKSMSLPLKLNINRNEINKEHTRALFEARVALNPLLDLSYYEKHIRAWQEDKDAINLVNQYLNHNLKDMQVSTIPERSYDLCGDEKWLSEKGGMHVLDRLKITKTLMMQSEVDPCMFAINKHFLDFNHYTHLIVENKSIYYRLLKHLDTSTYATLIYGSGWKKVSSFKSFYKQFPFDQKPHRVVYFGDLDREGLKIWHNLYKTYSIMLAKDFYKALIPCPRSQGKATQVPNQASLHAFCDQMAMAIDPIDQVFNDNLYIPQEALDDASLIKILGAKNG